MINTENTKSTKFSLHSYEVDTVNPKLFNEKLGVSDFIFIIRDEATKKLISVNLNVVLRDEFKHATKYKDLLISEDDHRISEKSSALLT